jgi:tRNA dimethylallyltransferase
MKLQLDPSMPVMKALGVLELVSYIKGEISLEQAKDDAKRATRNYAKRQMTWFRNQNEKANYIFAQYSERILDKIFSKIRF